MMNEIDNLEVIKKEEIDPKNYFKSLMGIAYEKGLFSEKDMENTQIQWLELLKNRVEKYNGFESSSILKDHAEVIMESNLYTIEICLKKWKPDEAIKKLKEWNLQKIYDLGRKTIDRKLDISRVIHMKAMSNKIETENETYNVTLVEGINGFFSIYNPDFEAHRIKITADYPLYYNIIGKVEGIDFIEEYVSAIYYENEFCQNFSSKDIQLLLYGYSESYKDLIINIFTIVLTAAIGCNLAGENMLHLTVTSGGLQRIYDKLQNKSKEEVYQIVEKEYEKIATILIKKDKELQLYIKKNFSQIQWEIYNALENKSLDKIFIVQRFIDV